jgi:hypothetical protein
MNLRQDFLDFVRSAWSSFIIYFNFAGGKEEAISIQKAGEFIPALFTEDAKKALIELRSDHNDKSENQKTAHKSLRRNANGQGSNEGAANKGGKDHQATSFPPITMLLKPKDQSKVKLANLRQRQNNQIDPSKVTDASICEESLKRALEKLRNVSTETGLNLNTKTLWVIGFFHRFCINWIEILRSDGGNRRSFRPPHRNDHKRLPSEPGLYRIFIFTFIQK